MSSFKYRIIHEETGAVQTGIVNEWPETEDDFKRKLFEEALADEGYVLDAFEKMWVN